jgi:hypothetical protein
VYAAPEPKAFCSVVPQETESGSPSPRNASVLSDRIAIATVRIVLAKIRGPTFGRMWRVLRCHPLAPSARDRST